MITEPPWPSRLSPGSPAKCGPQTVEADGPASMVGKRAVIASELEGDNGMGMNAVCITGMRPGEMGRPAELYDFIRFEGVCSTTVILAPGAREVGLGAAALAPLW